MEITERADGVLELRPQIAVPAAQAWFWTDRWQEREREADADLERGRFTSHDDVDAFPGRPRLVTYRTLESFKADYKRLKPQHQETFRKVVGDKSAPACDARAASIGPLKAYLWPRSSRVDELVGAAGIMELTWSYTSPDGRATFMLVREGADWICVWRRIGNHSVYRDPYAAPSPRHPGLGQRTTTPAAARACLTSPMVSWP